MQRSLRTLCSEDFVALQQLEADVFGAAAMTCLPALPAACTEFYGDTCFWPWPMAGPSIFLCFVRAVKPTGKPGSSHRVSAHARDSMPARSVVGAVVDASTCWFTVKPDNVPPGAPRDARTAEAGRVRDFWPRRRAIVSKIDRAQFEKLRTQVRAARPSPKPSRSRHDRAWPGTAPRASMSPGLFNSLAALGPCGCRRRASRAGRRSAIDGTGALAYSHDSTSACVVSCHAAAH